jgi:hypothetical protein
MAVFSCAPGDPVTTSEAAGEEPGFLAPRLSVLASPPQCASPTAYDFHRNCWGNGQPITLERAPQDFLDQQRAAVNDWNQYLQLDASAPRFEIAGDPGSTLTEVRVTAEGSSPTSEYCGTFSDEALDSVAIKPYDLTHSGPLYCGHNAHHGSWGAALRQELAGIIGWDEGVEASKTIWAPGMTTLCVLHLIPDVPNAQRLINPEVCAHEAEGVILAYRGLDNTVSSGRMFKDTLYMHVTLRPTATSLPAGDSVHVAADTFYSSGLGSGPPGMPALLGGTGGHIPVAKPTSGAVTFDSRSPSVLAHVGNGWFKGLLAGASGYVAAKPSGSPSADTRWWLPFKERGDSTQLSVTTPPPPPPPPFVVTSDQTPVTTPGYHTFTAHIGTSSSTIYWSIDDSRTTTISPDTAFQTLGQTANVWVEGGSYTLTFRVGLSDPPWQQQDIPVCTEPGEAFNNAMREVKKGDPTQNAVGGCPPPPGGGGEEQ